MGGDRLDLLARIQELEEENKTLQRALDKACKELGDFDMTFNNADFEDVRTKKQWKEWCMKDE